MKEPAPPASQVLKPLPARPGRSAGRTVLGFDFGTRRIGVAIAEERLGVASALAAVRGDCPGPDWVRIAALIEEWRPDVLVVGRPAADDGSDTGLTQAAEHFARRLTGRFGRPAEMTDERYSSVEASAQLREARRSGQRKRRLRAGDTDPVAAQLLLQAWLDAASRAADN